MADPSRGVFSVERSPGRADLVILGQRGGTNVGASLRRAADRASMPTVFVDAALGSAAPRILRSVMWKLAGHRPARLGTVSALVVKTCRRVRPRWILSTGLMPLHARALTELGELGICRLNYLTDDPWNPGLRSSWFLTALRQYDHVFSVRRANLVDLAEHGCRRVSYVPFGFDPELFFPEPLGEADWPRFVADVIFVGGADRDRVPFIAALSRAGLRVALYGDYWDRHRLTRAHHRGYADPLTLRKATRAAKVALCLVRRANRDGQVMRSYEAAATGACMVVEDTQEHRELFGRDGEAVIYFAGIDQLLERVCWLLKSPDERLRLDRKSVV